jgi:5-hydroxyisourate hydrolase
MVTTLSGISTHILDTSIGRPAAGVVTNLEKQEAGKWQKISAHATDVDGRVKQLLPDGLPLIAGQYRLAFETGDYFAAQKISGLYPLIEITFLVRDPSMHYHIPLLLTANSYSTYRGS